MFDAGKVTICNLQNTARPGRMPVEALVPVASAYFGERIVGYNRFYAALGANQQADLLIRIWRYPAKIGQYAVLSMSENDGQYRIAHVQHLLDEDGLKVTDLTLSAMEDYYDVASET